MELLAQAQEMAEGEDNHLFGMSVQPLSYLHENALPGEHKRLDCRAPLVHVSQHRGGIEFFNMGLMMEKKKKKRHAILIPMHRLLRLLEQE